MKKKIAVITTHPIQYNAPLFKLLAERNQISVKVFYTWEQSKEAVYDPDFDQERTWDIPLLDGYEYEFVKNTAARPGSDHFRGIINPGIIKQITQWSPDAVLIYGWAFSGHLKVLRHFKGKVPVFFRGDSTLLDEREGFSLKKMLRRLFLKWIYSFVDVAFYAGKRNKDYFLAHGMREDQLIFAPHSVDNERFCNNDELQEEANIARHGLSINKDDIVFLFAGKFQAKKDPLTLIRAFKELNNKDLHLILAGNGALEIEMQSLGKGCDNLHFMPFQNQSKMPLLYKMCDVFVLPSKGPGETWGLAVNEAMASGLAVIVSDKCGCSEDLVKNEFNGFVFKNMDVADLKDKLSAIANKERVREMGRNSLQMIQNISLERTAEALEGVLIN